MKEIRFNKQAPAGEIKGILRIIGKIIYIKVNNWQYASQLIANLEAKGAKIDKSSRFGWIKIDMFKDNTLVKLGEEEFDVTEKLDEEIEQILADFYVQQYVKAGFNVNLN